MRPSLFLRQKAEKAFVSWLFLGPVFMVLSTCVAVLVPPSFPIFLLALSLGLFFTIFFDKKGLILACTALLSLSVYTHMTNSHHIWLLALESSMGLSFFLTHQSFLEVKRLFYLSRQKVKNSLQTAEGLKDLLEEEKKCLQRYKKDTHKEFVVLKNENEQNEDLLLSYRKLTDILRQRDKQNRELRESFSSKKNQWEKEVLALQYSVETIKKHLKSAELERKKTLNVANDLRCSLYQQKILFSYKLSKARKFAYSLAQKNTIGDLEKKHLEEKITHGQTQIKKLCKRLDELSLQVSQSKNDAKYNDLKKQFEDKSVLLHEERKVLFSARETIEVLQRKQKEKSLLFSKELVPVFKELSDLEIENQYLEDENNALNDFISTLLKKPKVIAVERSLPFS